MKTLILPVQKADHDHDDYINVFIANSGQPDIIDDVLVASGVDLTRFNANPIVSYMHAAAFSDDPDSVIARGKVWVEDGMLMLGIVKYDDNELAIEVKRKIDNDMLNAVSVSFMPKDGEYKTIDGKERFMITKSELLEVSVVNIPADPKAVKVKSIEAPPPSDEVLEEIKLKKDKVMAYVKKELDEEGRAKHIKLAAYIEMNKI